MKNLNSKTQSKKKGAGKPALFAKPMKRVNVMLDSETVKFYTLQGKGNLSKGIREYWRGLTPREPDSLKAGVLSLPDVVKSESNLPA